MHILFYGINQPHGKGEFCTKGIFDYYTVCCFETPFLYERNGRLSEGNADDILITEPGQTVWHGPRPDAEEGFRNDWIYICGNRFSELLKTYGLPLNTAFSVGRHNALRRYIEKIKKEMSLKSDGYLDKTNCIVTEMVIDLYRMHGRAEYFRTPEARLEDARSLIVQNPEQNWTLASMAALCGYSPSRFSALYKDHFGCPPKNDLLKTRLELAEKMLKYSALSVTAVSASCGFQTIYYFSKYFKKAVGISPYKYALKYRRGVKQKNSLRDTAHK